MSRKLLPVVCGVVALGIAIGCGSESVLAPTTSGHGTSSVTAPARARIGSGDTTDVVIPLARKWPLDHDISATATIGPAGGSITLDAAGATIVHSVRRSPAGLNEAQIREVFRAQRARPS